jgi:tetratricopeptide (TPR) repeat protein
MSQRAPDDADVMRGVARSLFAMGEVAAARERFLTLVALHPEDVEGLVGLGACALRLGDAEAAVDALYRAQRLRPGHIASAVKLADALSRLERSTEALDVLERARGLHPESVMLGVALAKLHADRGEPELAVQALTDLTDPLPGGWWAAYTAARTWMRVGRYERALPILRRIAVGRDGRRDRAVGIAVIDALLALERWEEALSAVERMSPDGLRVALCGAATQPVRSIPALIHQYWEPRGLPAEYRARAEEWRRRNPDFTYRLWGPEDAERLLASLSEEAVRAFRSLAHPAMRADLFRYAVLHEQGGVYVDADLAASVPLRYSMGARPGLHVAVAAQHADLPLERIRAKNDFIAAPPQHPVLGRAVGAAIENILNRTGESLYRLAGPPVLSEALSAVLVERNVDGGHLHVWVADRALTLRLLRERSSEQAASHWTNLEFDAGFVDRGGAQHLSAPDEARSI